MKVLITGSSGFIGSHLVEKMKKEGFKVVSFDIKENKREDVRNFEALLEKSKGCDAIIHLTALCIDSESLEKPYEYFTTNIVGTLNALEVARIRKVKKIFICLFCWHRKKNSIFSFEVDWGRIVCILPQALQCSNLHLENLQRLWSRQQKRCNIQFCKKFDGEQAYCCKF